jgi:hypothetical protein
MMTPHGSVGAYVAARPAFWRVIPKAMLRRPSLNGCYVDMLNTFPVGDEIVIKIFAESECFEATAKVIYAQPNLGMGLAFQGVSLKNGELLRQWLQRASMVRNEPNS